MISIFYKAIKVISKCKSFCLLLHQAANQSVTAWWQHRQQSSLQFRLHIGHQMSQTWQVSPRTQSSQTHRPLWHRKQANARNPGQHLPADMPHQGFQAWYPDMYSW